MNFAPWFNCALLPEEGYGDLFVTWNRELMKQVPSSIVLDGAHIPHLTLYQAQFKKLQDIQDCVAEIVHAMKRLIVEATGADIVGEHFVFVDIKRTSELLKLHRTLLRECASHRVPMDPDEVEKLDRPPIQKRNLLRYGMALAGRRHYRPHWTIGHIAAKNESYARKVLSTMNIAGTEIACDRIAILDCDPEHGAATEILWQQELS